jgi:hypothetical protein
VINSTDAATVLYSGLAVAVREREGDAAASSGAVPVTRVPDAIRSAPCPRTPTAMDFDRRFKRSEFVSHLRKLGYDLSELAIGDLLKRTTKTTRGGRAFSFKPNGYALGWTDDAGRLHPGFECDDIRAKEDDPRTPKRPLASTLWIHLRRDQQVLARSGGSLVGCA